MPMFPSDFIRIGFTSSPAGRGHPAYRMATVAGRPVPTYCGFIGSGTFSMARNPMSPLRGFDSKEALVYKYVAPTALGGKSESEMRLQAILGRHGLGRLWQCAGCRDLLAWLDGVDLHVDFHFAIDGAAIGAGHGRHVRIIAADRDFNVGLVDLAVVRRIYGKPTAAGNPNLHPRMSGPSLLDGEIATDIAGGNPDGAAKP